MPLLAEVTCPMCGETVPRRLAVQVTCGKDRCRYQLKNQRLYERPEQWALRRERCHRWYERQRQGHEHRPWLVGMPPVGKYLPGGSAALYLDPPPRWPVELRNLRAIHGVLSELLDRPHDRFPVWSLRPCAAGCGWAVRWMDDETAEWLSGWPHEVNVFNGARTLTVGMLRRTPAPRFKRRGHMRVRVDAITPVIIRSMGGRVRRLTPDTPSMHSTISAEFPRRLGVDVQPDDVCLRVLGHETFAERVHMGGKYGTVAGWLGSVTVEVNAVARWLLECAAIVGLGGRTAFGFGAVNVEVLE